MHTSTNKEKEMGNIHLHFPTDMNGHKHIQKHKCQDSIQMPKYHSQLEQTFEKPQHPAPQ